MRPLLKWISATAVIAALAAAGRPACAQELQWRHTSRKQAPVSNTATRAAAPSERQAAPAPTARPEVEQPPVVKQPVVRQPVVRQPQAFKQPSDARPIRQASAEVTSDQPPTKSAAQRAAESAVRFHDASVERASLERASTGGNRRTANPNRISRHRPNAVGASSIVDGVIPAQWEETYDAPPCDCDPCECGACGGPDCMCEVGCGVPTCGCGGACGDPGCGFPTCGDGFCGDGCCGDAVYGEPTCGCGGVGCGDCCGNPYWWGGCADRGCIPIIWLPPIREIVFFGGVQGYKGPLDRDRDNSNFGFHEGFNLSGPMAWFPWYGFGYQFGYQATQNQLHGDSTVGTDDGHSQNFITTGLFLRRPVGLQMGVVWDYLNDERQGANNFGQVRGEIGLKNQYNREFGFAFAAHSNSQQIVDRPLTDPITRTKFQATDQYLLYYRLNGERGGEFKFFGGFDSDSSGILGSSFLVPLNKRFSLDGGFTYLIPDGGTAGSGARDEAWNLGMQLVWHYGNRAKSWHKRPYRPMFNVADNGSFIVVD